MKILVSINISVLEFYGYIGYIEDIVERLYQYDYENITKIDEQNCNAIKWNLLQKSETDQVLCWTQFP